MLRSTPRATCTRVPWKMYKDMWSKWFGEVKTGNPNFSKSRTKILVHCYNGALYYKENERTPGTWMTLKIEQKKPDSKNNIAFRGTYSLSSWFSDALQIQLLFKIYLLLPAPINTWVLSRSFEDMHRAVKNLSHPICVTEVKCGEALPSGFSVLLRAI